MIQLIQSGLVKQLVQEHNMKIILGDAYNFATTSNGFNRQCGIDKISDTKFIFCWGYRSGAAGQQKVYVCVGNLVDGVIEYGAINYITGYYIYGCHIKYLGNNTCLLIYEEWNGASNFYYKGNLLTIDGSDNISFGTSVTFNDISTGFYIKKIELLSSTLCAVFYGSSDQSYVRILKIDNSPMSFITGTLNSTYYPTILKLNSTQVVCAWDHPSYTNVQIMNVVNDVVSYSNTLTLQSGYFSGKPTIARISDTQFIVWYNKTGGAKAKICTISENVITAGDEISVNLFKYGNTLSIDDSNFLLKSPTSNYLYMGKIGTSLVLESETLISSSMEGYEDSIFLDSQTFVVLYGSDNVGYIKLGKIELPNTSNFFLFFD